MAVSVNGQTVATYNADDQLTAYNGVPYTYAADGSLASAGNTTYQYDALGHLLEVKTPSETITYTYDGLGRRVGKSVNGTSVQGFLYADGLHPIAELDGQGNVVATFVYGTRPNVPDLMLKGGVTYRIISDSLGSPVEVVDTATGAIVEQLSYDAWGNITSDTNPGFQPFGFAGGLYDADTGLVHFGARDYDPVIGRWTTRDPLGFAGGDTNLYGYVLQDPVDLTDPVGLATGEYPPPPPGYDQTTWQVGQWDNGRWVLTDPQGRLWTIHPEDSTHWRHWDKQGPGGKDDGRWPPNSGKPRPGQKQLKPNQCPVDPNGDASPWSPPADNPFDPFVPTPELWPLQPAPSNLPALEPIWVG